MADHPIKVLNVFFSYAPEDEAALNALEKHLSQLKRNGQISSWNRQKILAGQEALRESQLHLATAHIIILLVSADFIASDYCYSKEMEQAIERHNKGEAIVIPVIVRPVDWINAPFHHLQALPRNGKPVSQWKDRDSAWTNIVGELRQVLERLYTTTTSAIPHLADTREQTVALPPIWNVPYRRNPFFTGRDGMLNYLRTTFTTEETTLFTQPYALSGLGGTGKTQIAVEYAYRYRNHYITVLWLNASSYDTLLTDAITLAKLLHLTEADEMDHNRIVQAVQEWLGTHRNWLLIIDGVNASELSVICKEVLPFHWYGHILLTTRMQATEPLAQSVPLETLEVEEACHFLLKRAHLIPKDATLEEGAISPHYREARAIVELLDGFPLAIEQAGAYIYEKGSSLAGYQQLFSTQRQELLRRHSSLYTDHPLAFYTTWQLSFRAIEHASVAALELLRLSAFLAPEQIQDALLLECGATIGLSFAPTASDILTFNDAIGELLKYSLIKRHRGNASFSMQRLVQTVLQDEMDSTTQQQWAEQVVHAVSNQFPQSDFVTWEQCEMLLPHAMACSAHISHWHIVTPETATLLHHMGEYLLDRARYSEAQYLVQRALDIRTQILGEDHPDTAHCLQTLGELALEQGNQHAARQFWQQALTIRTHMLGAQHAETAYSLFSLAKLSRFQGDYKQAEQQLLDVWAIYEHEQVAPLRRANCLFSLYGVYSNLGMYPQSEQYAEQAVNILEQEFGMKHPHIAKVLLRQAYDYLLLDKYEQALTLFHEALELRETTLGQEHPHTIICLESLAFGYLQQRNFSQSELYYQRALEIHKSTQGSLHPDVAGCLSHLASLYEKWGDHAQAEQYYEYALTLYQESLGTEHVKTVEALRNLASFLQNQNRYEQAEPLFQQCLMLCERLWGHEHAETVKSMNMLASLYQTQGKFEQAGSLSQQALAIADHLHIEGYSTAELLNRIIVFAFRQRNFEQMASFVQRLRTLYSEKLPLRTLHSEKQPYRRELLSVIMDLFDFLPMLMQQNDKEAAKQLLKPLMTRSEQILESLPAGDIIIRPGLLHIHAAFHFLQGNFAYAETLLQEALTIYEHLYGPEHVDTIASLKLLACNFYEQETEPQDQRALAIYKRLVNLNALDAISCVQMADILRRLEYHEEALVVYDKALQHAITSSDIPSWVWDDGNYAAWVYSQKSFVLNHLNRREEALAASDEALQNDSSDAFAYRQKAIALNSLERYSEALAIAKRTIELDPRDAYAYGQKGYALKNLGQNKEALVAFDQALSFDASESWFYVQKSDVLNILNRREEALSILEQALAFNPQDAFVHTQKAIALNNLERFTEALQFIDKALQLDSNELWVVKGLILNNLERYEQALEVFEQCLQSGAGDLDLYVQQGNALTGLGRYEEALAAFGQVIKLDPMHAVALRQSGFALLHLGSFEEALQVQECSLIYDANDPLTYCHQSYVLRRLGRCEEALSALKQALALDLQTSFVYAQLGFVLNDLSQYKEALAAFDRAIDLGSDDPEVYLQRNNVLIELENV